MKATAQAVDECVVSGWNAADIAEEFGIPLGRALELMHRRDAMARDELTPEAIVDGLNQYRTLTAWAASQGVMKTSKLTRITSWRKLQTRKVLEQLRHDLERCGLRPDTIDAVCGKEWRKERGQRELLHKPKMGRPFEYPPAPTRAELAADAEHIARWGYV